MWIKAQRSQAKKPLIITHPLCNAAQFLTTTGKVALVDVTKRRKL
jgi:hypothetical protein